ncbi:MAG: hypothetical protein ACK4VV_17670, partial [Pseudomonas sp.]
VIELSGGNQQKVVVAKALVQKPALVGLVNEVWPLADLMPCAQALARAMTRASPEVLRRTKRLTASEWRYSDRQSRLRAEIEGFAAHLKGHDLEDGLNASAAKRNPVYRDVS